MDTLNINSRAFSCMISICDKRSVVVLWSQILKSIQMWALVNNRAVACFVKAYLDGVVIKELLDIEQEWSRNAESHKTPSVLDYTMFVNLFLISCKGNSSLMCAVLQMPCLHLCCSSFPNIRTHSAFWQYFMSEFFICICSEKVKKGDYYLFRASIISPNHYWQVDSK